MASVLKTLYNRLYNSLASSKFFVIIMVVFAMQALYFSLSAVYPMVFDENTHLGIIQLHAEKLSPIFTNQPANSGFAGELTRNPSYIFHYLMSFPYRLISAFSNSQMIQIIFLRLFNVLFFAVGIVLFRKLLRQSGLSARVTHVSLLFFVLIPVVPLLAGQINYDNLIFPLSALLLLLAVSIDKSLRAKQFPIDKLLIYLSTGMIGCLVKFTFLPLFLISSVWLSWRLYKINKCSKIRWGSLRPRSSSYMGLYLSITGFLISLALFGQMYGLNIVKYHSPTPRCEQILSENICSQNGPWLRDHEAKLHSNKLAEPVDKNPARYSLGWFYRMLVSNFYTSSGGAPEASYLSINPLPVAFIATVIAFIFGLALVGWYNVRLIRPYKYLGLLVLVASFYAGVLWLRNYQDFASLGEKVAINGRYILPVSPIVIATVVLAYQKLLSKHRIIMLNSFLIGVLLLSQGGGAITYVVVSQPNWYWQNEKIIKTNQLIQKTIKPLVILKAPISPIDN